MHQNLHAFCIVFNINLILKNVDLGFTMQCSFVWGVGGAMSHTT
jgi:hypothetical protein